MTMRSVIELAGIKDILTKSLGTNNPINTVRATMSALQSLRTAQEVADLRGKSVEDIVGKEPQIRWRGHLPCQRAGEIEIFCNDIEGPAGAEGTGHDRARNIVEGPAGAGAQRDDPRERREVDPGLRADQHPLERRNKIGIAEILRDELGDAASPSAANVKDIARHRCK